MARNLFVEMDRAGKAYRSEVADKLLLMPDYDYRQWEVWQKGATYWHYFGLPMRGIMRVQDRLALLRESEPDKGYFIDVADRLYDRLSLEARAGLGVAQVSTDIRRLPPMLDPQELNGHVRNAVPHIQQGMDQLVEADYLPSVRVSFAGCSPRETYYMASVE